MKRESERMPPFSFILRPAGFIVRGSMGVGYSGGLLPRGEQFAVFGPWQSCYHETSFRRKRAGVEMSQSRTVWASLSDGQLLAQCEIDTYRASGPGGQKRNKTSSAVRIRHAGSGLIVIAEESRSQHENRARALKRLRQALYLKIREAPTPGHSLRKVLDTDGRLHLSRKDARYWPTVGLVLDILESTGARVSDAAAALGISTGNLVDFLGSDPRVWEQTNHSRARFGLKPLRSD